MEALVVAGVIAVLAISDVVGLLKDRDEQR